VIQAANADEAIAILTARTNVHVVFTDKIVATSGLVRVEDDDLPAGSVFLPKPYHGAEVVATAEADKRDLPSRPDWIHEVKYGGYRGSVIRDGKDVKVLSKQVSTGPGVIVEAARKMKQRQFIIDGEICVLDVRGVSQFDWLHSGRYDAQLYAFDIVALDGGDLRELPLHERKSQLAKLLQHRPEGIFVAPFEPARSGLDCSRRRAEWSWRASSPSTASGGTGRRHATG
jgi:bifunctional non-homologous end joining protein LigD